MSENFNSIGNIADLFNDQKVHCANLSCRNTWMWYPKAHEDPKHPPKKLCEKCQEKLATLSSIEQPCNTTDCSNKWTYTPKEQLNTPDSEIPVGYCSSCSPKFPATRHLEQPCRIKECNNTWLWSKYAQSKSEDPSNPPKRLCDDCLVELNKLENIAIECKVESCHNHLNYSPMSQLIDAKAGKEKSYRPRRMCQTCAKKLEDLKPITVKCKIVECNESWHFSPYAQLEYYTREGNDAPLPERMCDRCRQFKQKSFEQKIPCINKGCNNTSVYTKREQLANFILGKTADLAKPCADCSTKLASFETINMDCKHKNLGCENKWQYTPEEQLANILQKKNVTLRECPSCTAFLSKANNHSIACSECSSKISFSPFELLLEKFGKSTLPTTCPDCLKKQITDAVQNTNVDPKINITHHTHVIKIPTRGAWQNIHSIKARPLHQNADVLRVVDADVVIVLFADHLAFSDIENNSWSNLLEQVLNTRHPEYKTVVINSIIPNANAKDSIERIERDVTPFEPNLVLFSFDHLHSIIKQNDKDFKPLFETKDVFNINEKLMCQLTNSKLPLAYFTPPPIIPELQHGLKHYEFEKWAQIQKSHFEQIIAHSHSLANKFNIPVVDLTRKFKISGNETAKKWMETYNTPNQKGKEHIANWLADYVDTLGLYD